MSRNCAPWNGSCGRRKSLTPSTSLAGGIAHDFNNVVGAILGWAELGFDQNRANPQVAERFTRIREQAERAATLTRELLAFARRQVLQPRAVDLNTVAGGL